MNYSTRLRLAKEARALLPYWASIVAIMAVPRLFQQEESVIAAVAYWLGGAVLGPVSIGHEFQHRTLGGLLAQPLSRRRLWWEKLAVLALALLGLWVCNHLLNVEWVDECGGMDSNADDGSALLEVIMLSPVLLGFCTGPTLTLLTRSILSGVALTFLCPWALFILSMVLPEFWLGQVGSRLGDIELKRFLFTFFVMSAYGGGLILLGCHRFQHWEDRTVSGKELALPLMLTQLLDKCVDRILKGRYSALGQLVRKELHLQQLAFVVAGLIVVLWLLLAVDQLTPPAANPDFLMVPAVLLGLGIPVIAGIVSTAEERSWGLHDWHLTLPVSARRQWFIKVLVALGVNVVLGLLLPGGLCYAASWLVGGNFDMNLSSKDSQAFLIANSVIFCAALYASTAAANSMRALVGTILLFLAGAMVMNLAIMTVDWLPDSFYPMPDRHGWWPAPELCRWAYEAIAPLGWGFLGWFGALGLSNFRRSIEAGWRPVRRLVPFVATIWLVLASVFTYLRMFSHYEWTYYEMSSSLRWDSQNRAKQRAVERGRLEVVPPTPAQPSNTNPAKPRD